MNYELNNYKYNNFKWFKDNVGFGEDFLSKEIYKETDEQKVSLYFYCF